MFSDKISDYFEGVAAKHLSVVDTVKGKSNQHEIGGLIKAGFGEHLGSGREDFHYGVRQVYIKDEQDDVLTSDGHVTWYDARRDDPNRGPEYRLYYYDNQFTEMMNAGDFFLIAKLRHQIPSLTAGLNALDVPFRDGHLLMVCTPAGSAIENQLRAMFGLDAVGDMFKAGSINAVDLILPLRTMLEELGLELGSGIDDETDWLATLIQKFGGAVFPETSVFSAFARETLGKEFSALDDPDAALMSWMEREESLFRIYERHLVRERLMAGFGAAGEDVDAFIDFSLSVQNRRKSRVGHAFEGHLKILFSQHKLPFEQGKGKGRVTEGNSKPDFLFPSFAAYHDQTYPAVKLVMLGAKTTCKDRWRQVLAEAKRIERKHLITLEPAISGAQTEEMRAHHLQLVIPAKIHVTYSREQQSHLLSVKDFIQSVAATIAR